MPLNSATLIQEIRTEFETMLDAVQTAQTRMADSMERQVFSWLLALGGQLLHLYFVQRSANSERSSHPRRRGPKCRITKTGVGTIIQSLASYRFGVLTSSGQGSAVRHRWMANSAWARRATQTCCANWRSRWVSKSPMRRCMIF